MKKNPVARSFLVLAILIELFGVLIGIGSGFYFGGKLESFWVGLIIFGASLLVSSIPALMMRGIAEIIELLNSIKENTRGSGDLQTPDAPSFYEGNHSPAPNGAAQKESGPAGTSVIEHATVQSVEARPGIIDPKDIVYHVVFSCAEKGSLALMTFAGDTAKFRDYFKPGMTGTLEYRDRFIVNFR